MQIFSYDDENLDRMIESLGSKSHLKTCLACGKQFIPGPERNASRRKYCYRVHYCKCNVCGTEFVVKDLGYPNCTCSLECASVAKHVNSVKTMQAKYGVNNPSQHPEFHAKAVASINKIRDQIAMHATQTMQERYGGMGTQSPEIRAKIEKTIQEKYGVRNVSELPEIRKKISEAEKTKKSIDKRVATSRKHYGVDYPAQSEEVQYMMRKTCMERYGVEYVGSLPDVIEKRMATSLEKFGYTSAFFTDAAREKAKLSMIANCTGRVSKLNRRFGEFLSNNRIDYEYEFYLGKKWYDIHILNAKIVIEIDPSYTHSTVPSHWTTDGLDVNYHKMRTQIASESGYRCIHIFDWDDWDKLLSILKQPTYVVGARKCELRNVSQQEADSFLTDNHLQGAIKNASEAYGLYYEDRLLQLMSFGRPRYTHKYDFELLRLCTLSDYIISGGAERLFTHFVRMHPESSILSYCDLAKFSGDVYSRLGFHLDHVSSPAKVWSKESKKITDNLLRQRGYDQLFGTNYGKGTSNEDLMIEHGWLPVYDCGQSVYVYSHSHLI